MVNLIKFCLGWVYSKAMPLKSTFLLYFAPKPRWIGQFKLTSAEGMSL